MESQKSEGFKGMNDMTENYSVRISEKTRLTPHGR